MERFRICCFLIAISKKQICIHLILTLFYRFCITWNIGFMSPLFHVFPLFMSLSTSYNLFQTKRIIHITCAQVGMETWNSILCIRGTSVTLPYVWLCLYLQGWERRLTERGGPRRQGLWRERVRRVPALLHRQGLWDSGRTRRGHLIIISHNPPTSTLIHLSQLLMSSYYFVFAIYLYSQIKYYYHYLIVGN